MSLLRSARVTALAFLGTGLSLACSNSTGTSSPCQLATLHPSGTIVATRPLDARPFGAAVSSGGAVYVTRLDAASLARANLPDTVFTGAVTVGAVPTGVAFSHDGQIAYVTNQFGGSVSVVNVATNQQVDSIRVNGDPAVVTVAPDDRTVFVSTTLDTVYRFDRASKAIVAKFGVPTLSGVVMNGLTFSCDGTRLYASTRAGGTVIEFDTKSNTVLRTLPVGGQLQGIAISPEGDRLYVADEANQKVRVWNLLANSSGGSIDLGFAPFDLQLTPDGTRIWVGVQSPGAVLTFDRSTLAPRGTIVTNGVPRRIAFERDGSMAVIANESGWVDFVE